MSEELKPCPFCGSLSAIINHIEPHKHHFVDLPDHEGSYTIECSECDLGFIRSTEAEAIAAWNRRTNAEPAKENKMTKNEVEVFAVKGAVDLPHLPAPDFVCGESTDGKWAYTPDQMREYGRQCAALCAQPSRGEVVAWMAADNSVCSKAFKDSQVHAGYNAKFSIPLYRCDAPALPDHIEDVRGMVPAAPQGAALPSRDDVLEEAARECERINREASEFQRPNGISCARAIRALQGQQSSPAPASRGNIGEQK